MNIREKAEMLFNDFESYVKGKTGLLKNRKNLSFGDYSTVNYFIRSAEQKVAGLNYGELKSLLDALSEVKQDKMNFLLPIKSADPKSYKKSIALIKEVVIEVSLYCYRKMDEVMRADIK